VAIGILAFLPTKADDGEEQAIDDRNWIDETGNNRNTDQIVLDPTELASENAPEQDEDENDVSDPVMVTIKKMWKLQIRPQFMIFTLFIILNAFLQGISATSNYKIIEDTISPAERQENFTKVKIAFAYIAYGVCGVISGHILGKLLDKFARKKFVWAISVLWMLTLGGMLVVSFQPNYFWSFIPSCMLGALEAGFNSTGSTILGKDYKGRLEAFSLFKFHQCLWTCLPSLLIMYFETRTFLYIMIGLSGLATVILFTYNGEPDEGTEVIQKGLTDDGYKKIGGHGDLDQNEGEWGIKKLSPES
jgi:hypothetical protein